MRSALSWLGALVLVVVFVWAAAAKLFRFGAWREALRGYGFSGSVEAPVAVATPIMEAAAAVLVLFVSVKTGAALSLVLLGGFSLAVLRARSRQGDRIPCGCFGRAKERDYRLIIGRNLLLVGVTAVVLLGGEPQGLLSGGEVPPASDVLPASLAAVGIGLMAVVLWQAGKVMSSTTGTAKAKR